MARHCKVCFVGEMAVGKTSLSSRYITGAHGSTSYRPNFAAAHMSTHKLDVEGKYGVFIWDTAGSERFRDMTPIYLRGAHCCLLTFSLIDRTSFSEIENYWAPSVSEWSPTAKCVLVANKVDDTDRREVTHQEIKDFCNARRMRYFETSAVTGQNVDELFQYTIKIADRQRSKDSFLDSFQLNDEPEPTKKNRFCCTS